MVMMIRKLPPNALGVLSREVHIRRKNQRFPGPYKFGDELQLMIKSVINICFKLNIMYLKNNIFKR